MPIKRDRKELGPESAAAKKSDLLVQSTGLGAFGQNILLLYLYNAEKHLPVEKSCLGARYVLVERKNI